jgi:hypothetical protein
MHIVSKLSVSDRPGTAVMPLKCFYYSTKYWCVQASIVVNRPAQTKIRNTSSALQVYFENDMKTQVSYACAQKTKSFYIAQEMQALQYAVNTTLYIVFSESKTYC